MRRQRSHLRQMRQNRSPTIQRLLYYVVAKSEHTKIPGPGTKIPEVEALQSNQRTTGDQEDTTGTCKAPKPQYDNGGKD